jgi:hypothetical protein
MSSSKPSVSFAADGAAAAASTASPEKAGSALSELMKRPTVSRTKSVVAAMPTSPQSAGAAGTVAALAAAAFASTTPKAVSGISSSLSNAVALAKSMKALASPAVSSSSSSSAGSSRAAMIAAAKSVGFHGGDASSASSAGKPMTQAELDAKLRRVGIAAPVRSEASKPALKQIAVERVGRSSAPRAGYFGTGGDDDEAETAEEAAVNAALAKLEARALSPASRDRALSPGKLSRSVSMMAAKAPEHDVTEQLVRAKQFEFALRAERQERGVRAAQVRTSAEQERLRRLLAHHDAKTSGEQERKFLAQITREAFEQERRRVIDDLNADNESENNARHYEYVCGWLLLCVILIPRAF